MDIAKIITPAACALSTCMLIVACAEPAETPAPKSADSKNAAASWRMPSSGDINTLLDCLEAENVTLISAHRGGSYAGLPENSLETMAAVLQKIPAIVEIDVAASADGVLFLMHDDTLTRTTTGEGLAAEKTWNEIKGLKLEDKNGAKTAFAPPRFDETLKALHPSTILQIDFKRSAKFEDVVEEVKRQGADHRVIYIAYSLGAAQKLHRLHPDAMISLSLDSQSSVNEAIAAGLPADRLIGFTGIKTPNPRLYDLLDERDIEVIFGTLGGRQSIDNAIAAASNETYYAGLSRDGVDILATDRPFEAYEALLAENRAITGGQCGVTYQGDRN